MDGLEACGSTDPLPSLPRILPLRWGVSLKALPPAPHTQPHDCVHCSCANRPLEKSERHGAKCCADRKREPLLSEVHKLKRPDRPRVGAESKVHKRVATAGGDTARERRSREQNSALQSASPAPRPLDHEVSQRPYLHGILLVGDEVNAGLDSRVGAFPEHLFLQLVDICGEQNGSHFSRVCVFGAFGGREVCRS